MASSKQELIDFMIGRGRLETPRIIEAFKRVDRKKFVLPEHKSRAYVDHALPHLAGQTISQPSTVAVMLELLQPEGVCLEIGTGSGWMTALLAELCDQVYTIERKEALFEWAKDKLKNKENVHMKLGDGSKGMPGRKFDRIIASAFGPQIPGPWKKQLAEGGKLVMPVQSAMLLGEKKDGEFQVARRLWGFVFVPLVGKHGHPEPKGY